MATISVSRGNSKLGSIPSVSLPAITTCRKCDCQKKCYAKKLERLRPTVRNAYANNLQILNEHPDIYWREVEAAVMMSRFFRFHVSGDIVDYDYFDHMVDVANRNKHCNILCFTKKYEIVNEYCKNGFEIPENLHIIFSAWVGLEMINPFSFPTAHVRFRDGSTTAREDAVGCAGNCSECAVIDGGCWGLRNGEQVVFDEH